MCKEIEFVRQQAKRGHSFSHIASLLGFYPYQLRTLLEAMGANDIEFVNGYRSLAKQRQLADLHSGRRERPQPACPEALAALERGRQIQRERHMRMAFGVNATLRELKVYFGCKFSMNTLWRRIRKGMSVEDALTRPREFQPRGVIPPQFVEQCEIRRRRVLARCDAAIARLLTPSMLQFRSERHDIIVIGRDLPRITVEIREKGGKVLHQLRFVVTYESGVLFLFSNSDRSRIDFIAFEPSCKALIKRTT